MNQKLIALVVFLIICTGKLIKAQQNNIADKKYSVIIPDDYQNKGKSYPLVVCYQNQITDSLFQDYSNNKQIIIIQLDNAPNATIKSESLKEIILKTMHDFTVTRDKIFLLGVNQNIRKTAEVHEAMNYYYASTAYITDNRHQYKLLNDSLKQYNSTKIFFFDKIDSFALETTHKLFSQNHLWTFEIEKISEDAIRFSIADDKNTKNNWQLSISYGQWYFTNSAKSSEKAIIDFPESMGIWNFSCARHLSEHLSVNVNLGILLKKNVPPRPDVFSIIGGADFEIEGGGIFLMPVSIGVDYIFMKQRFRPYVGFSFGIVPANYKYIEASGNLSNGINKNEYKFNSNAPFVEISSGFFYCTGKNVQLGLNCDYIQSKNFNENIGGYKSCDGFKVSLVFSVLF